MHSLQTTIVVLLLSFASVFYSPTLLARGRDGETTQGETQPKNTSSKTSFKMKSCLKSCENKYKKAYNELVKVGKKYCQENYSSKTQKVCHKGGVDKDCAACINNHFVPLEKNEPLFINMKLDKNTCEGTCHGETPERLPVLTTAEKNVNTCPELRPFVEKHFNGNKQMVQCYMSLFLKETSCRPWLTQSADVPGNSYAGYGICTIEKPSSVRSRRGPNCADIATIDGQIKCCRHLMRSTTKAKSYYGPVRIGKQTKCE